MLSKYVIGWLTLASGGSYREVKEHDHDQAAVVVGIMVN